MRVGGCRCPISSGVSLIILPCLTLRNKTPNSASAADSASYNSTNKVACRAKNILFAQSGSVCSMDLQDHGTGERAFVQHSSP